MAAHREQGTSPTEPGGRNAELFALLQECAALDKICPNLGELAGWFGVANATVHDMLSRLRREGAISWRMVYGGTGVGTVRIVTITATGKATLTPEMGCRRAPRRFKLSSAEREELERAKTVLRRLGRIVFDAQVTDGAAGRGLVKVDGRNATPAEVIARAGPFRTPRR